MPVIESGRPALALAFGLLLQDPAETPYPYELVPVDALRGHLMEGEFKEPAAVFFEPSAREVFVADMKNGLVGIFDEEGVPLFAFGGREVLEEPRGLHVDRDGDIRVLQGDGTSIEVFDYRGTFLRSRSFTAPGAPDEPIRISAFTLDADGNWIVGALEPPRVHVFEADGAHRYTIPSDGRLGEFEVVSGIAVAADGRFAVSDYKATPVQIFSREGRFLAGFGKRDIGLENFTAPSGIAFDREGFVYVADLLRHNVKVYDGSGRFVAFFGGWFGPESGGRAPGEMLYPNGIAIAPDGPVFVSERYGNRVQLFERRPRER